MNKHRLQLELLVLCVFLFVALVIGSKPLLDLDIGWHLAGGLWILDAKSLPTEDPFGAQANFWLNYSWLTEVIFALIYLAGGFKALQLFQTLSVVVFVGVSFILVREISERTFLENVGTKILSITLCLCVIIFFTAPVWHLRPQLFSLIFFVILFWLAERDRITISRVVPLCILWVNVHVYWLLVPLVVVLYVLLADDTRPSGSRVVRSFSAVALLLLIGFVTPYGWKNFQGLYQYLFFHSEAYSAIKEFQQLSPSFGFLFWFFLAVVFVAMFFSRAIVSKDRPALVLFVLCAIAGLMRIKFLPLFGIAAAVVLGKHAFPIFAGGMTKRMESLNGQRANNDSFRGLSKTIAMLSMLLLLLVGFQCIEITEALPERYKALLSVSKRMSEDSSFAEQQEVRVLNHFNDGGWLALAFWLSRPEQSSSTKFKTSIDGRTLVVGAKRLRDFAALQRLESGWCAILEEWNTSVAILPAKTLLARVLSKRIDQADEKRNCVNQWTLLFAEDPYIVLMNISAEERTVQTKGKETM